MGICRSAMQKDLGGVQYCREGWKGCVHLSWAARAPYSSVVLLLFCYILILYLNTSPMSYIYIV